MTPEQIKVTLSIILSSLAIAGTVVSYVLIIAKVKWEVEQIKIDREKHWNLTSKHEIAIQDLQIETANISDDRKRIIRMEEQIHDIALKLEEVLGEVKTLTKLLNGRIQ